MKASAGKILMLVENAFPQDSRVRNEADALTSTGYSVTIVALRSRGQSWTEVANGIRVYRIPRLELFSKTTAGRSGGLGNSLRLVVAALGYICEYSYFTSACLAMSAFALVRHGFDVIHTHNPPDTLFVVGALYKLFGKKYVFDHHDLSPELYCSRLGNQNAFIHRLLILAERYSLKYADLVIATNESYKQIEIERGSRTSANVVVVRNGPNAEKMQVRQPSARLRSMGRVIICYIGCLNPQDGVDYLLRALHHLVFDLKRTDFYCVVMGSGDSLADLRALRVSLDLADYLEITGFIPEEELTANLSAADICVDPDPSNPLNDQSTWIKIMEYMAYGKPIVSFDLKETRISAQEAAVYVEPNDELAFAKAIAQLMEQPELQRKMGAYGRRRVEEELQWAKVGQNLLTAYETLMAEK